MLVFFWHCFSLAEHIIIHLLWYLSKGYWRNQRINASKVWKYYLLLIVDLQTQLDSGPNEFVQLINFPQGGTDFNDEDYLKEALLISQTTVYNFI